MTDMSQAAEAIGAVSATDPEIKTRVKELALFVLDEVEEAIRYGAPMTKMAVMRSFTPHLIRSLQDKRENEEIEELKREMEELRREIRAAAFPEVETFKVVVGEDKPNEQ